MLTDAQVWSNHRERTRGLLEDLEGLRTRADFYSRPRVERKEINRAICLYETMSKKWEKVAKKFGYTELETYDGYEAGPDFAPIEEWWSWAHEWISRVESDFEAKTTVGPPLAKTKILDCLRDERKWLENGSRRK